MEVKTHENAKRCNKQTRISVLGVVCWAAASSKLHGSVPCAKFSLRKPK
jgi:hypothetical protein